MGEKMIRYNLSRQGLQFKSDFNWNYELVEHLLEIRTMRGYLKADVIKDKKTGFAYISKGVADFRLNRALFNIFRIC